MWYSSTGLGLGRPGFKTPLKGDFGPITASQLKLPHRVVRINWEEEEVNVCQLGGKMSINVINKYI